MAYDFIVLKETNFTNAPDDGVYINGLFLDGARFNRDNMTLDESLPKILYDQVPHASRFISTKSLVMICD